MTLSICFGWWLVTRSVTSGLAAGTIIKYRDGEFSPALTIQSRDRHNQSIHEKKRDKENITLNV